MERRSANAILIGVVIAIAVGVAGAVLILNNDDNDSYTLTYFSDGKRINEVSASAGSVVTIADIEHPYTGRFIGWNTNNDGTGTMMTPGTKTSLEGHMSLHAVFADSGKHAIILPSEQKGYTIKSNMMLVEEGGDAILSYTLAPSHTHENLVISVNGSPIKLDGTTRIYLSNIREDQVVVVTGVYDKRTNTITLPENQVGYVLTSSAEWVHYGESYYLEYKLLPGYTETSAFSISIVDGVPLTISDGKIVLEDVRANHVVTVTGIEAIKYKLTAGKNVTINVNGSPASTATVEDRITIVIPTGYSLPSSFNKNIKGSFEAISGGYKATGNMTFPAVLKVTAGDNVKVNGQNHVFVCPEDRVKITASSGYELPAKYSENVASLVAVTEYANGFSFSDDVTIPSIYKLTFRTHDSVFTTTFAQHNDFIPKPKTDPSRSGYSFLKWDVDFGSKVTNDQIIKSIWVPHTYKVSFGPNLTVTLNGDETTFTDAGGVLLIKTDEEFEVATAFGLDLPNDYSPKPHTAYYKNGKYTVMSDSAFPGVAQIIYFDPSSDEIFECSATIGRGYSILTEPTWEIQGRTFSHWVFDGAPVSGQITIENKIHVFTPVWKN